MELEKFEITVKTLQGLEEVLGRELLRLGAEDVELYERAVGCKGTKELLYRANYELRTALRVLVPISTFTINSADDLYTEAKKLPWNTYLNIYKTFAIDNAVKSEFFQNTTFAGLRLKDAIADYFTEKSGKRPSVDTENPSVRINLYISGTKVIVSLDSSGEPLFKRGYRIAVGAAPLNEVLAAGLVQLSGWKQNCNFLDPMCGSGTIAIEAAMLAYSIPAQIKRAEFGFMRWRDFDLELWEKVRAGASARIKNKNEFSYRIIANDSSDDAVRNTQKNVKNVGLDKFIETGQKSIEYNTTEGAAMHVIMNPPYGERLDKNNVEILYKKIGTALKRNFAGAQVWILSCNQLAINNIGLHHKQRFHLKNGAMECKFMQFEIYEGSIKAKFRENIE